jgi:predicted deacylase
MKELPRVSHLEIGSIGSLIVRIPTITLGNGLPHLALICGVHGNETASLIIVKRVFEEVMSYSSMVGSVSVITSANPFAQSTRTRVAVSDFYDLNRTGEGKPDGTLTERVAFKLSEYLRGCSYVIDLHEFEMDTPTMAIYIPSKEPVVDRKIIEGISAFNPVTIWAMDATSPEETKYSGAILSNLIGRGIPGFAIETSRAGAILESEIQEAVDGLLNVAKSLGVLDGKANYPTRAAFVRKVKYADSAGIWIPTARLMSQVSIGEPIGELSSLDLTSSIDMLADENGILIQLRSKDLVDTGTSLFTIGIEDSRVVSKFHSVLEGDAK